MKRIIVLFAFLMLATFSGFANDVKVSPAVRQAFKAKFTGAENVTWSEVNEFTVAAFTLDDIKQYAYFNNAGELTVLAQPLTLKQLSKKQQANLQNDYNNYAIVDLYKTDDSEEVRYYAVIENETQRIILSTTLAKWEVVKTINR